MRKFYTYAYLREDKTPYYIGKGCGNRCKDTKNRTFKPPKDRSRILILKSKLTEEEAYKHERYMIAIFGRKDLGTGILHNHTDGGDGPRNFSSKVRSVMSAKATRPCSNERAAAISKSLKGRTRSQQERKAISKGLKGKKKSPEAIAKREETKRRKKLNDYA